MLCIPETATTTNKTVNRNKFDANAISKITFLINTDTFVNMLGKNMQT